MFKPIMATLAILLGLGCSLASAAPQNTPSSTAIVSAQQSCADLTKVDITDIGGVGSVVKSATETTVNGSKTCVVEGTMHPTIGFKLSLPLSSWTQRFLQIGCGGLCGNISETVGAANRCVPLHTNGLAIAATDMGHEGMSAAFGNDPQKRKDFAYRAQHLTAEVSKKLIHAYYGRAPSYAYFTGCSDGGREALIEAQRYPNDFNGIIAGAEAMNFQAQNGLYHAWQVMSNTGPDGKAVITAAVLPLLHKAVLDQCDALDGQKDGLITDPRLCHFDPSVLLCKPGQQSDNATCLSAAQVTTVRKLYDGPRDPKTGERLIVSGPQPGSELAWAGVFVPQNANQPMMSSMITLGALQYLSFETNPPPGFRLADLTFDTATFDKLRTLHPLYDATNPDLTAFVAHGGKLILWHGWADPHISPLNTIAYHEALQHFMGEKQTQRFERLYLLPGVHHCGGGEGPSELDLLTPMMHWVENGKAPNAIVTSDAASSAKHSDFGAPMGAMGAMNAHPPMHASGAPGASGTQDMAGMGPMGPPPGTSGLAPMGAPNGAMGAEHMGPPPEEPAHQGKPRSRPVYPYPFVAAYSGHGDPDKASSYVERKPLFNGKTPDWMGADFYQPYTPME